MVGTEGHPAGFSSLHCVSGAVSYTLLYNCLDFPAGVVPVTTVTAEDEAQMEHYKGYFGDIWDKVVQKVSVLPLASHLHPNSRCCGTSSRDMCSPCPSFLMQDPERLWAGRGPCCAAVFSSWGVSWTRVGSCPGPSHSDAHVPCRP